MKGNFHVRFLGEAAAVMPASLPDPRVRPERKQDALVETEWTRVLQRVLVGNRLPDYSTWDVSFELKE